MKAPGYALGIISASLGAACWSLGGFFQRATEGPDAPDVWQIILYRSSALLICMVIWLVSRHGARVPHIVFHAGSNAIIAGFAIAVAGLTFLASLFYTTVAQSIFMTGLSPFSTALLGMWILRERVPQITWIAMALALGGMLVILFGSGASGSLPGTVLAIVSAFCFSCYSILLRWGQSTDMTVALVWNAFFLIAASIIVLAFPTGIRAEFGLAQFNIGWFNIMVCLAMGAIQLTLGLMLYTYGSRSVPAAQLSLIALIEPTLSPLWVWLLKGELPPVWTFIGGAVILAAIALQTIYRPRNDRPMPLAASRRYA